MAHFLILAFHIILHVRLLFCLYLTFIYLIKSVICDVVIFVCLLSTLQLVVQKKIWTISGKGNFPLCCKFLFEHLFVIQSGEDLVIRNKEAQKQAAPVVARSLKKKHPDGSTEAKLSIAKLQGLCYINYNTSALIS